MVEQLIRNQQVTCSNHVSGSLHSSDDPLYGEALASVHAAGFEAVAEAAARHLIDLRTPGHVVDLGCGSGPLLEAVLDAGWTSQGYDASPHMVELARRRLPGCTVEVADAGTQSIPPCDAITAVGEVIAFASAKADRLPAFLARAHEALRPGGVLLFDLPTFGRADPPTTAHVEGNDWSVDASAHEDGDLLVRRIAFEWNGQMSKEVHRLRLYDPDAVLRGLKAAGFRAERLGGYDDHGFVPGWDGFEAFR